MHWARYRSDECHDAGEERGDVRIERPVAIVFAFGSVGHELVQIVDVGLD